MPREIIRATGVVSSTTLLSRIAGFARDIIVANMFGTSFAADAFFVAFRIPNLLRKLFAEGALNASFIPVFSDYLSKNDSTSTKHMVNAMFTVLFIVISVITAFGMVFTPAIVKIIAPGFSPSPTKFLLTTKLTRMMFPYLLFISITAFAMGILNTLRHFFFPALAPVLLNVCIIACALLLASHMNIPVMALAIGVLIGGFSQLAIQTYPLKKNGFVPSLTSHFLHPAVKEIVVLMLPAILGLAVNQINMFVDTLLATYLPEGSVSYLYYSNRLVQLPLGLFGIAMGTVVLPVFSLQTASNDLESKRETLISSLCLVLFICMPAMVGLIVLRHPLIAVLFERGAFTEVSTIATSDALLYYSVGLWAYASVKVLAPLFYAEKDTQTPTKISIITLLINIVLNLILMVPLKHNGLALATALSASIHFGLLTFAAQKRFCFLADWQIAKTFLSICTCSGIMGIALIIVNKIDFFEKSFSPFTVTGLFANLVVGICVYLCVSWILKSRELAFLVKAFKKA